MMNDKLNYRLLRNDEWELLEPIFREHNWYLPSPLAAVAAVAEENDKIKAVVLLQTVLHGEPVYVEDGSSADLRKMYRLLEEQFTPTSIVPGYIVLATNDKQSKALEMFGMQKVEGQVWMKVVKPKVN